MVGRRDRLVTVRHIYYTCMRCAQVRCMACETPAPAGYSGEIKTAVRWCDSEVCVADEATANGISIEAMKAHKVRVHAAWRLNARCIPS